MFRGWRLTGGSGSLRTDSVCHNPAPFPVLFPDSRCPVMSTSSLLTCVPLKHKPKLTLLANWLLLIIVVRKVSNTGLWFLWALTCFYIFFLLYVSTWHPGFRLRNSFWVWSYRPLYYVLESFCGVVMTSLSFKTGWGHWIRQDTTESCVNT